MLHLTVHKSKQKCKQTLESAQFGQEIALSKESLSQQLRTSIYKSLSALLFDYHCDINWHAEVYAT